MEPELTLFKVHVNQFFPMLSNKSSSNQKYEFKKKNSIFLLFEFLCTSECVATIFVPRLLEDCCQLSV